MPNLTFLALFSVTLPQKLCSSTLFPGLTKVFFWHTFLIILIFPALKPSIISGIHTGDDRLMLTGARQILQLSKEDLGETIGVERSVVNWSTYWINVADRWLSGMLAQWLFSRETEAFIFFLVKTFSFFKHCSVRNKQISLQSSFGPKATNLQLLVYHSQDACHIRIFCCNYLLQSLIWPVGCKLLKVMD